MKLELVQNIKYRENLERVIDFLKFLNAANWTYPSLYSKEHFQWKIIDNNFGESFCYLRFIGDIPVAHSSITSKPLNENLNIGIALGELGDSHTHPDFQKQGHFGEIGSQVINEFNRINNNDAVIFGIPNENAVKGWQTRCNCELLEYLNIGEFYYKKKVIKINLNNKIEQLHDFNEIKNLIDEIWKLTYKKNISLIKKDFKWWNWRYNSSPEKYKIFTLKNSKEVYLIAKFTRKYFFNNIDICDIFGINQEVEIEILKNFISRFISPLNRIRVWSKINSEHSNLLLENGFEFSKKINFVMNRNLSHQKLKLKILNFELSLGDTDNV